VRSRGSERRTVLLLLLLLLVELCDRSSHRLDLLVIRVREHAGPDLVDDVAQEGGIGRDAVVNLSELLAVAELDEQLLLRLGQS
jgi:hypothetical protein